MSDASGCRASQLVSTPAAPRHPSSRGPGLGDRLLKMFEVRIQVKMADRGSPRACVSEDHGWIPRLGQVDGHNRFAVRHLRHIVQCRHKKLLEVATANLPPYRTRIRPFYQCHTKFVMAVPTLNALPLRLKMLGFRLPVANRFLILPIGNRMPKPSAPRALSTPR